MRAEGWSNVRFAWMGTTVKAPGTAHYYRIQGTTFLIEYDNTQNHANHQHIVWRDFKGDFGDRLAGAALCPGAAPRQSLQRARALTEKRGRDLPVENSGDIPLPLFTD